jgi:hypothetical protein
MEMASFYTLLMFSLPSAPFAPFHVTRAVQQRGTSNILYHAVF